jgi:2-polyprenyl-3-methyl-5-hydroxy-6-metoxy-1,4-benzoquinol methylase
MNQFIAANRKNWNERVSIHSNTSDYPDYNISGFNKGKSTLKPIELKEIGIVKNKKLLHLQCHFGLDTLSWARRGASVTGVDFSEKAIQLAKELSLLNNIKSNFICSNIFDLKKVLKGKFDIVFASYGILCWINNLNSWLEIVSYFLKPNGIFFIIDSHPFSDSLSYDSTSNKCYFNYSYFNTKAYKDLSDYSYVKSINKLKNNISYEWKHTLSELINGLLINNLDIINIKEYHYDFWNRYPNMRLNKNGYWKLIDNRIKIPLMYSIKAKKKG